MTEIVTIKITADKFESSEKIVTAIKTTLQIGAEKNIDYTILKKSIDARSKIIYINLKLAVYINEPKPAITKHFFDFKPIAEKAKSAIIIGAGPAGIFAALQFIELGIKPIIIERGKDVRSRRRDLAELNKEGVINEESNYCFGEGGAGTYSDGKLYTRSNKRGNIDRILQLFVQFGADENILYEAHPHIGTNKLPHIITAMRQCIIDCGGEVQFDTKLVDFDIKNNTIEAAILANGNKLSADVYLLATGHSARDIFELLYKKNILIEAKPFALGVRIEHPQHIIDNIQYKCTTRPDYLPAASYSLVEQVQGKGVFSFCMCPGGIMATASTSNGELVVNGWSPSKRNNPFANSGMVVEIKDEDLTANSDYHPLLADKEKMNSPLRMMYFQQAVEQRSFEAGGDKFIAPAQRVIDFCKNITSTNLPAGSYIPGLRATNLHQVLPKFVSERLALAIQAFGQKLRGYYTNEAIVVATESRTSSPVKIPRDMETLQHPEIENLFPCGEGAGYAGGIVSAAMDGERCAVMMAKKING